MRILPTALPLSIKVWTRRLLMFLAATIAFLFITIAITRLVTTPSNEREWSVDQAVLPYAEIDGSTVSIHNIRNFIYTSTSTYTPQYYDKTYDLTTLKKVWYVVEPFPGVPGSAHTFLSFEFENDVFLAISIEVRKEKGELFNTFLGLFNKYELMYVLGDERDLIKLRTNYRKDPVYVYPASVSQENAQKLFIDMLTRANTLKEHPEFYNTITSSCMSNIVEHINAQRPGYLSPLSLALLFPRYSARYAYELGLIDTALPFKEARERYFINDRAEKYVDNPSFSRKIREEN